MEIEFAGAAREVTGSCHIVRANGKTVLLDCGMFQGSRSEAEEKNRKLPLPIGEIDAVVLSPRAPRPLRDACPSSRRAATPGRSTRRRRRRDLCAVMLADSARIQENDADFLVRQKREVASAALRREGRRARRGADASA